MKLLALIVTLALFSSSFALLDGYTAITDPEEIAGLTDVLENGARTSLLLARNDPFSTIAPGYYTLEYLKEFGAVEDENGTFYQMLAQVADVYDRTKIIGTVNCVLFKYKDDGSFMFMSYNIVDDAGNVLSASA